MPYIKDYNNWFSLNEESKNPTLTKRLRDMGWTVVEGNEDNITYEKSTWQTTKELMQYWINIAPFGYCNSVGKYLSSGQIKYNVGTYSYDMGKRFESKVPGNTNGHLPWNTFFLPEFYYSEKKLYDNIHITTGAFPDGIYNWFNGWFGTDNVNDIKREMKKVFSVSKPFCVGSGNNDIAFKYAHGGGTSITVHDVLFVLEIATAFIPVVGPWISAGFALVDAGIYAAEGDYETAGLYTFLTLIPVIGPVAKKVGGPLIKKIGGETGMKKIASKIDKSGKLKSGKTLTADETELLKSLKQNEEFVKKEVDLYVKQKSADLAKTTTKTKVKTALLDLAKTGAIYGTSSAAYTEVYKKTADSGALGTTEYLKTQGYSNDQWPSIKRAFGSDGTAQQNEMIVKAMKVGWKPGIVVPKEFQTKTYIANLKIEQDGLDKLKEFIA